MAQPRMNHSPKEFRGLTNLELNWNLDHVEGFLGTFARDQLPHIDQRPASMIINTDLSNGRGQHWVALWVNEANSADYFDSYGLPPLFDEIAIYLKKNFESVNTHNQPLQPFAHDSLACGHYCALFIISRARGLSMAEFKSMFSKNLVFNDANASLALALEALSTVLKLDHRN